MRPITPFFLLLAAAGGCDVGFVAVDEPVGNLLLVSSQHHERLEADVSVHQFGTGTAPMVTVLGQPVIGTAGIRGQWIFDATVLVDSLAPVVPLTVVTGDEPALELLVPVLARRGPARWLASGDLTVPVVLEHSLLDFERPPAWSAAVLDSAGRLLLEVRGEGHLPVPLVLPGNLIPDSAATVEVTFWASLAAPDVEPRPWTLSLRGKATIPIPGSGRG